MRVIVLILSLVAASACDESVTGATTPLNSEFTLAPGQAMVIERASLTVRFNGLSGDSRCPADAVCIQGGSADVRVTAVGDRSTRDYVLKTGDMRPVQHDDLTISLVQVTPYPFSSRTIQPDEYRVTLKVTR
jgi:hypothetical protein